MGFDKKVKGRLRVRPPLFCSHLCSPEISLQLQKPADSVSIVFEVRVSFTLLCVCHFWIVEFLWCHTLNSCPLWLCTGFLSNYIFFSLFTNFTFSFTRIWMQSVQTLCVIGRGKVYSVSHLCVRRIRLRCLLKQYLGSNGHICLVLTTCFNSEIPVSCIFFAWLIFMCSFLWNRFCKCSHPRF